MRKLAFLTAAIVITFVSLAGAQANRTWVSGVGDDANPCSRTAPCLTLDGTLAKTATGGEINCLDPGDFATQPSGSPVTGFTITKSITIDCGFNALNGGSLLVSGANGIDITGGAVVTIRNLVVNGGAPGVSGGLTGINITAGGVVHLENVKVNGFTASCVTASMSAASKLTIENSSLSDCGPNGVSLSTSAGTLQADFHNVKIWNAGASTNGILAGGNSRVSLKDSDISFSTVGVNQTGATPGSTVLLSSCNLSFNGTALKSTAISTMSVTKSAFHLNGVVYGSGNIFSAGDNIGSLNTLTGTASVAPVI